MESFYCGRLTQPGENTESGLTLGAIGIVKKSIEQQLLNEKGQAAGFRQLWLVVWYGYDLETLELVPKKFDNAGTLFDDKQILALGELSEIDAEEAIAIVEGLKEDEDVDDLDTEERTALDVNAGPPGLTQGEPVNTPEATI